MAINSRQKGKRGELELAHELNKYGYSTRRSQQYAGINNDADVVGLPNIHIECKRVEKLNLDQALDQAIRDAAEGEVPVVMHRKSRQKWRVTMPMKEFMEFYQAWEREMLSKAEKADVE